MSYKIIEKIITKYPDLNDSGLGLPKNKHKISSDEYKQELKESQKNLLESTEDFRKACQWLSSKNKIQTINRSHSSYGLKKIAEKEIGYISNGIFIAAAIHCGFKVQEFPGSPNVCINISEKSLKDGRRV
jgi:hypothetical protein